MFENHMMSRDDHCIHRSEHQDAGRGLCRSPETTCRRWSCPDSWGPGKPRLCGTCLKRHRRRACGSRSYRTNSGSWESIRPCWETQAGQSYVELEGGCVCCKLSDELVTTLQRIREEVHPDRIVVETSGVALPFDTLLNFWREPVSEWVGECLSAVVVNAEQVAEDRDLEGTFEQQASSADLLILNKLDLVSSDRRDQVSGTGASAWLRGRRLSRLFTPALVRRCCFRLIPESYPRTSRQAAQHMNRIPMRRLRRKNVLSSQGIDPRDAGSQRIQARHALRAKGFVQTSEGLRLVQGVGPRVDLVAPPVNPPEHLLGRSGSHPKKRLLAVDPPVIPDSPSCHPRLEQESSVLVLHQPRKGILD